MTAALTAREFRDVMGCFATGVTVITAAHDGARRGMTANAFSSVSLDPPLLLVCVARTASMFPLLSEAETFAVNILAADQQDVSTRFAKDGDFANGPEPRYHEGEAGTPVLDDVLASAVCRVYARYDGGDHMLLLGEVLQAEAARPGAEPLLFFQGRYREIEAVRAQ